MTSQPDKLFRDKLENFQRPAPVGAWDKIENNLSRTNRKIIWVRMAAAVALFTTAAIVLWPAEQEPERIALKHDQLPVRKNDNSVTQPPATGQPQEKLEKKTIVSKTERTSVKKQSPAPVVPQKTLIVPEPVVMSIPEQQEQVAESAMPEVKESSTTIVYTAAQMNAKFLKKKLPVEATPDLLDASGLQKLIGLAYTAKNSETVLGELRQKKDEILALGFGKIKGEN